MAQRIHHLYHRARTALRMTQVDLARMLGASRRTGQRWDADMSYPAPAQLTELAKRVHAADPKLAADIAASLGTTVESLGLTAGSPHWALASAGAPVANLVDSVVCAAAEAMDVAPRAVRPALLAALSRAREMQLTLDVMEQALEVKLAPKSVKARKS